MRIHLAILSFLLTTCLLPSGAQGYEIKIKVSSLKDSTIMLWHHYAKDGTFFPDDTVKLDHKGVGTFKGNKPL